MVVQFVGFLAAFRHPGPLPSMLAGTLGGLFATWCTFVPCFLWIGLGAPFIERLRDNKPPGPVRHNVNSGLEVCGQLRQIHNHRSTPCPHAASR